jgi:hypothetical protein
MLTRLVLHIVVATLHAPIILDITSLKEISGRCSLTQAAVVVVVVQQYKSMTFPHAQSCNVCFNPRSYCSFLYTGSPFFPLLFSNPQINKFP